MNDDGKTAREQALSAVAPPDVQTSAPPCDPEQANAYTRRLDVQRSLLELAARLVDDHLEWENVGAGDLHDHVTVKNLTLEEHTTRVLGTYNKLLQGITRENP